METNKSLINILEVLKNFDNSTPDYEGVLFANIYKEFAVPYKVYIKNEGGLDSFVAYNCYTEIQKTMKKKIDVRHLIKELHTNEDKYNIKVVAYNEVEYIVFGTGEDNKFVLCGGISHSSDEVCVAFLTIFTSPKYIHNVLDMFEKCIIESKKAQRYSFGIATCSTSNIYTSWYDFEDKNIDIDANYNDDFKEPYEKICQMIETENKTGLSLLYGEPGTGKSSIIKHLIAKYSDKDFIFIDDSILTAAPQDKLMSYFLENNDTVFVLEDCEKVLMSRDISINPLINTILNITDGIMGDVLGIKLICTFNTSLTKIDKALLRKGRLTVKYEFKKLVAEKASKILGEEVTEDMTLAEIYNINEENDYSPKDTKRKIGYVN